MKPAWMRGDQIVPAMVLNTLLMLLPRTVMAAMQITAMSASSSPYSASEAPSSSRTNLVEAARSLVIDVSPRERVGRSGLRHRLVTITTDRAVRPAHENTPPLVLGSKATS